MDTKKRLEEAFMEFIQEDDLPFYTYVHDREGVFTYISPEVTDILGYSVDEFKEFYLNYATGNPLNKEMIKHTQECLKGLQQAPYKVEVYDKEYNTHYLKIYERPVFEGEKVVAIEGVAKLLS